MLSLTGLALAMIAAIYLFMSHFPSYGFRDSGTTAPAEPSFPADVPPGTDPLLPSELVVDSKVDLLTTLLIVSGCALVVHVVLAAGVGWLATGRVLRSLQQITATARRTSAGRLDQRIALRGPQDELKDLSDTLDGMLARLERAFHAHQRFAANASHELRTPLATMQAVLDVAIADPDAHDVRALATKLRTVNRRSIDTVDALLDLADAEQGHINAQRFDLAPMVGEVMADVRAEAAQATVRLKTHVPSHMVTADPVLLRQLVLNLVQNAVRHNIPGGTVTVTARAGHATITLRVSNTGRVIPSDVMPLLTEPFYRGAGRTISDPRGRGLGLALAASIAAAHRTDLVLTADPRGGLTAEITLR
ncbi:sensor histidine kinase [Streptomyces sp. NPDC058459]|uniref:sensor histidine kinase n=1 Tax=Streptomyces sp. NPDC058459 TaxID=3346508 RepID=UPI00365781BD